MKTTFIVFFLALLVVSCNDDDDDSQHHTDLMLDVSWSLVNVSNGFAGVDNDFEIGIITWNFNSNNFELTVTNSNITNVIYDGFSSGTYDYEVLTSTEEDDLLIINTFSYGITALSATQLILDEGVAADGFLLTFSR